MSIKNPSIQASRTIIKAANRLDLKDPGRTSIECFQEVLAYMHALREVYRTMHWKARGTGAYSDHLLFERLYSQVNTEIDETAEHAIGLTGTEEVVEPVHMARRAATFVDLIYGVGGPTLACIEKIRSAEHHMTRQFLPKILVVLEQSQELPDGTESFLQRVAETHMQNLYLLTQRLRGEMTGGNPINPNPVVLQPQSPQQPQQRMRPQGPAQPPQQPGRPQPPQGPQVPQQRMQQPAQPQPPQQGRPQQPTQPQQPAQPQDDQSDQGDDQDLVDHLDDIDNALEETDQQG